MSPKGFRRGIERGTEMSASGSRRGIEQGD